MFKNTFLSFLSICVGILLSAQVTTIDFETAGSGYTPSGTSGSGFTDVFNRANPNIGGNSSYIWAVEDNPLSNPTITLDQIDVTGSTSFTFSIDMLAHHYNDWDAADEMKITYSLDGGTSQNLLWVQSVGTSFNTPAALDTDFNNVGNCGVGNTLPSISTGTSGGCTVSASNFATFTTSSISLSSNTDLDITIEFVGLTSNDEGIYLDNIVITETGGGCTPPSTQPTSSSSTNVSTTAQTISWVAGSGANTLVVLKAGSAVAGNPSNGTTYSANSVFGTGDDIATGEEVVYANNGSSVAVTGLTPGTTYHYAIFEYDGAAGGECYLTTSPETGSFTMPLPGCTTPSTQVSSFTFSNIASSSIDVTFGTVTADSFLVVRSTSSSLSSNPVNMNNYVVGASLGGGTVVYNDDGTGLPFTDSGLSAATTYYYFVFAFNGVACSGGPLYLSPGYSDNETTITGPCLSDDFNAGYGNWSGSGTYQNSTAGVTGNGTGFNSVNDNITTTAAISNPNSISFEARASSGSANYTIEIQYASSSSGPWTTATSLQANGSNSGDITTTSTAFNLSLGLTGSYFLRIEMSASSGGSFYLDDVDVFCGAGCTPPITQASSASISNATSSSLDISWTAGSGTNSLVVIKAGSAVSNIPTTGTAYSSNTVFGLGDDLGGSEYVVYNGTGTSLTVTGLSQGLAYHVAVFTFNSVDDCYNQVSPALANGTTLCNSTPDNVTGFSTSGCSNGGVSLNWTNPAICWDNVLVFASETTCTSNIPTGNGAAYSPANTVFGLGDDDLDPGLAYLVYKGTGNSVSLTGLTNGQEYCFKIFTRNGTTWSSGVEVNCTPSIPIPDNACGTDSVIDTINYIGTTTVDDINVFVSIDHPYRQDLSIKLISPSGTVVELFDGSNSGAEDNLEVIFDDAGSSITSSSHTINGIEDETVTSDVDLLSTVNGETSNGNWVINICDAAGGDLGSLVSWDIDITESCTPTHTVDSILPNNGPEGTQLTISGTGFTDSTTVSFGDSSAIILAQTDSTLLIVVPEGASTGFIDVIESSCPAQSDTFTVIGPSGSCASSTGAFTDLIISEVYDADLNNVWYIELFNPTSSPIDLAAGDYEIDRYADLVTGTPSRTIDLVGTVPAGGVFVANLGTSTATCTYSWDFTQSGSGINEEDRNVLTKGGVDLDAVSFPNETGYTIIRKNTATGPTATYNAADWDLFSNESCGDLGTGLNLTSPSPTFSSNLTNQEACELDFTVSVVEGDSSTLNDLTFKWYYNDKMSDTWTEVTSTDPPNLTILGEDTTNLLIGNGSSSIATISGYQFYCEVAEDTTCMNASNAATFEFRPEPYFRTIGAGLGQGSWNDTSIWEMSTDLITWSSACTYPTATNSDTIIIQASDSVAVVEGIGAPDILADQLYVAPTGILLITDSAELNIDNGSVGGEDILIDGILIDQASNGAGNGMSFVNGSTWALGANGTIIKTYSSSVNVYKDNYETGIANIPATAHWAYVNRGQGLVAVSSVDMYYPNLYFESVSGNYDASAFNEIFKGQTGFTTVKGDLSIGLGTISAGTGTFKVYNNNFNTQEMLILGDVYIGPGSEFVNASYNGGSTSSHDNGTGIEVRGSFLMDGTIDMSDGMGNVLLSGTAKQDIVSASGTGIFNTYDFELDNAAHAELDDIDLNITNVLTFTSGKIITDVTASDMVYIENSSTSAISGGVTSGSDRYVEGKLQWAVDGSSTYTFPVGHGDHGAQGFVIDLTGATSDILAYLDSNDTSPIEIYAYCDLEAHPGGGTVNAGNGNSGFDGILDEIVFNLESPLQWNITNPGGGITLYDLTVLANGSQDINPVTTANGVDVRYLMKNGEPGNTGVATGQGLPSFTTSGFLACPNQYDLAGLTSFSKFTLNGANQANTTLPVELLYFEANLKDKNAVICTWSTATEINNDFFTVERSADGINFEGIGTVEGSGSSNAKKDYSWLDNNPFDGTSYYRLRQTDYDGTSSLSNIDVVQRSSNGNMDVRVYPSPFDDYFYLSSGIAENVEYALFNVSGQMIQTGSFVGKKEVKVEDLGSGVYFIQIQSINQTKTIRLIKK